MARGFVVVPARTLEKGDVMFRRDDAMNGEAYLVHEGKVEGASSSTARSES